MGCGSYYTPFMSGVPTFALLMLFISGDGQCDAVCDNAACNWDGGDCLVPGSNSSTSVVDTQGPSSSSVVSSPSLLDSPSSGAFSASTVPICPSDCIWSWRGGMRCLHIGMPSHPELHFGTYVLSYRRRWRV